MIISPSTDIGSTANIDEFRDHCRAFIAEIERGGPSLNLAMAKSKADEMIYWLRADEQRRKASTPPPRSEPDREAAAAPQESHP